MLKILAITDTHGNVESAKALVNAVAGKKYDAIIFAGDFTSFKNVQETYEEIMDILGKIGTPIYYVFGNRDRSFDSLGLGIWAEPEATRPTFLDMQREEIGEGVFITANPLLADDNTIFISHRANQLAENALLHLEGHIHYGIYYKNYINLGFLFRDDFHADKEGLGCYWEITISGKIVKSVKWKNLGIMKELKCKVHKDFLFVVPEEFEICPLCKGDYEWEWEIFFGGEVDL
jgi:predicted phosphodiesterase